MRQRQGTFCPGGCLTDLYTLADADTVVRLDGSVSCLTCWEQDQADAEAERIQALADRTGLSVRMIRAHNITGGN